MAEELPQRRTPEGITRLNPAAEAVIMPLERMWNFAGDYLERNDAIAREESATEAPEARAPEVVETPERQRAKSKFREYLGFGAAVLPLGILWAAFKGVEYAFRGLKWSLDFTKRLPI